MDTNIIQQEQLPLQQFEDEFKAAYAKARVPRAVYEDVQAFRLIGISYELMIIAIEESEIAPHPSWAYARKILSNCVADGCFTPEDFAKRQVAWKARRIMQEAKASGAGGMITRPREPDPDLDNELLSIMARPRCVREA